MSKADAVENHGQKLFAATENLLMPMVQFGFLFPVVLAAIVSTKFNKKLEDNTVENSADYERTVRVFFNISQILPDWADWSNSICGIYGKGQKKSKYLFQANVSSKN